MEQIEPNSKHFTTDKIDSIPLKKRLSMTGWLPERLVFNDRFERFTSHSSGFTGGH